MNSKMNFEIDDIVIINPIFDEEMKKGFHTWWDDWKNKPMTVSMVRFGFIDVKENNYSWDKDCIIKVPQDEFFKKEEFMV